jgi:hypothetical protein
MAKRSPYVHENLSDDDDEVLKDGEKRTVSMMMRDALTEYNERFPTNDAFGLADSSSLHRPGQRFSVDAAARARVEQARAEGIQEMCDAWKRKPDVDASPPAGAYPLSAGEGSRCTVNGADGRLVRRGDWLVCKPVKQDAVSRTMTMDEAQRIKDKAWLESVQELEQAWKR